MLPEAASDVGRRRIGASCIGAAGIPLSRNVEVDTDSRVGEPATKDRSPGLIINGPVPFKCPRESPLHFLAGVERFLVQNGCAVAQIKDMVKIERDWVWRFSALIVIILGGCDDRGPRSSQRQAARYPSERHYLEAPAPPAPPADPLLRRIYDAGAVVTSNVPVKEGTSTVTYITFKSHPPARAALEDVARITGPVTVEFDGCDIPMGRLGALTARIGTTHIVFQECMVASGAFAELNGMVAPLGLQLVGTPLDETSLSGIDAIPGLTTICIYNATVTGRQLRFLSRSRSLRMIYLPGAGIDDDGLSDIVRGLDLTSLDLSRTAVTDRGIILLEPCVNMARLRLAGCKVTDASLRTIGRLTQLVALDLSGTALTDGGLCNVRFLRRLQNLGIADTNVTAGGLECLTSLPNLVNVGARGTSISEADALRIFPRDIVTTGPSRTW